MLKNYKIINYTITSFLVIFVALLASCKKDNISGEVVTDPQLLSDLYSKSLDTLTFQGNKYVLETHVYRDFFPGGPIQRDSPLEVVVDLVNTDSLPVSGDLQISGLYVINDQQIWLASLSNGSELYLPVYKVEKVNNKGPKWATDVPVDVIIEIENKLTQAKIFLIARNQYIVRAE